MLLLLTLLPSKTSGFQCIRRSPVSGSINHATSLMTSETRLFMSNETMTNDFDDSAPEGPLANMREFWISFSSTPAYRTVFFSVLLLSSPKFRDLLGLPICSLIVLTTWALYTYETKFNDLCDRVAPKRQAALKALREAKAQQLTSAVATEDDIELLSSKYEEALREELDTRVVIPGIWVIEMDADVEDRTAAPQLLGLTITDEYTLEPLKKKE